jgi:hypothetical protein
MDDTPCRFLSLCKMSQKAFRSMSVKNTENFKLAAKSPGAVEATRLSRVPIDIASGHCESVDQQRRAFSDCQSASVTNKKHEPSEIFNLCMSPLLARFNSTERVFN